MEELSRFEDLRMEYDRAFERFSREVRALRFAEQNTDREIIRELQQRVIKAELVYRERRDELAQFLLAPYLIKWPHLLDRLAEDPAQVVGVEKLHVVANDA